MRRAAASLVGPVLALLLAGCSFPPGACPAVAWNNSIAVDSSAYPGEVFIQICTDSGCSAAPGVSPTPATDFSLRTGDGGAFHLGMTSPDRILVRVYDASGSMLSESEEPITWTRSTDPCGGPSTAPPIVLEP